MRRGFLILGSGFVAAVTAYCAVYLAATAGSRELSQSSQPELLWLKEEFHLSSAELARVSQLHEAYMPQCKERCRRIQVMNASLDRALIGAPGVTPEIEKLLADRAAMRAECQAEMLRHFFEVSRTMPPAEGKRYLAWVMDRTCLRELPMIHQNESMHDNAMGHAGK